MSSPIHLGIDFGTSNSVVSIVTPDGQTKTLTLPVGRETCRTVLCLWQEQLRGKLVLHDAIGDDAIEAYLDDPAESRLILSMKSYLAQASFRETRLLGHRLTLEALIATFLRRLMDGFGFDPAHAHATVGRPVRFAGERADDDLGAERLQASLAEAGFSGTALAYEPEAAGQRFARRLERPAVVLVGDFGGGTSDFSVLRFDPAAEPRARPLGHAGVGIAGDQLDYRILTNVIAPHLGMHETYRVMGGAPLPVPVEWYADLGRWHRLSLMRNPQTLRAIADVARTATHPEKLRHLIRLIEDQQAHALYGAVARAKAALSRDTETTLRFCHAGLEIEETITRDAFEGWIAPDLARFATAIDDALASAGCAAADIDRVFLTGGTSFVPSVRALFSQRFSADRIDTGGEFVSVAEGLALIGAERAAVQLPST
ncbi:Hsp70 family protein [Tanticharoenia sakaeratensis]|uniref:Chaperone protein dnaK n=1 Tax=Tanticharoenia sakaeratensis NBRC 103193 TaxID=1231623 RepID=A0A0D6ML86_9PROT|nr:Hsp70 family protein [Tanticharoenia sakaeratensis]GAN54220.1 chaperone protein dnaK [Tanticharoenia sakaeratensis NBRC 103193]GBQ19247.1 molecular chaperone DnaK [Tanticharoenia sakaeratensis NBRC 103193]